MNTITFEAIHHSLSNLDLDALGAAGAPADPAAHKERVLTVYRAIRPLLVGLTTVTLVPPQFRAAMTLFLTTFDGFANSVSASGTSGRGRICSSAVTPEGPARAGPSLASHPSIQAPSGTRRIRSADMKCDNARLCLRNTRTIAQR